MVDLTQDILKSILSYDKTTGKFYRHVVNGKENSDGSIKTSLVRNQLYIKILDKIHRASHLAWLYVTGDFLDKTRRIIFINDNPADVRFKNLRVTKPFASAVGRKVKKITKTKPGTIYEPFTSRGYPKSLPWRAKIKVNGKFYHLGQFPTEDEAYATYLRAEKEVKQKGTLTIVTEKINKTVEV